MERHPLTSTSDPEHWEARAKEDLAMAEHMTDPDAKWGMLTNALDYATLAERARARRERKLATWTWPGSGL